MATECTCLVDQPAHRLVLSVAPAARVVAVTNRYPEHGRRGVPGRDQKAAQSRMMPKAFFSGGAAGFLDSAVFRSG